MTPECHHGGTGVAQWWHKNSHYGGTEFPPWWDWSPIVVEPESHRGGIFLYLRVRAKKVADAQVDIRLANRISRKDKR